LIIAVPEIKETILTKNDRLINNFNILNRYLLMGCDGVFETLNHMELIGFINDQLKTCDKEPSPE
jgi:protein phosphatase 1G